MQFLTPIASISTVNHRIDFPKSPDANCLGKLGTPSPVYVFFPGPSQVVSRVPVIRTFLGHYLL